MSTHCNVAIKLKEEDLNTELPLPESNLSILTYREHPYLQIYIHFDGNPDVVGKYLLTNLKTYEEVKDYILHGDRRSAEIPYMNTGESLEDNLPNVWDDPTDKNFRMQNSFYYLFADDEWWVSRKGTNHWDKLIDEI